MRVISFKFKKYMFLLQTSLFFSVVGLLSIYSSDQSGFSYENYKFWVSLYGAIGWISFFWSIITWKILRNEWLSIYNIFLVVLYLFSFGHSLMLVLGLVVEPDWLLTQITIHQLMDAQKFTLLCLISFHIGALMICKQPTGNIQKKNKLNPFIDPAERIERINKSIKYVAFLLFIISFPSFIYNTINTINTVMHGGYMALYGYDNTGIKNGVGLLNKLFSFTSQYFVPALICLLVAYRNSPIKRKIVFILISIYIITNLYIGGRNDAVSLALVVICIYNYSIKPIKFKGALKVGFWGYLFVSFLTIVAKLRSVVDKSIADYFVVFVQSFFKENLFVMTIVELGGSMYPLAKIMQIFPSSINYWEGKSYLYAMFTLIPNLGFWEVHPAIKYADGANWLMSYFNMSYGPGFSLFADAFRNFGWMGFFVFILFGLLFSKMYSSVDKNTILTRPDIICLIMIFAKVTMMSVRGDNLYIIRPLFFIVIPIYILFKLTFNRLK